MRTTITIARQLGSGGSYVGQLIASRLGLKYVDREVLHLAAQEFRCDEKEIASRAERISSFWEKIFHGLMMGPPEMKYVPPPLRAITDQQLFDKQTDILKKIAKNNDCVIVGWGGAHVLPHHQCMFNIFCHAPVDFRSKRVTEIYNAQDEKQAKEMIRESDEMRKRYIAGMTGKDWTSVENYHLSIDTSLFPLSDIAELIIQLLEHKGLTSKS